MIKCKQNYIGKKFNHLTVIEQVDDFVSQSNNRHRPQFLCQCDCKKDNPNTIVVRLDSLKSGHTTSCGCMKLKHTLDLCEAKRQPMKNSEFLELNLKDESHSLFGRCQANNSENYFYFSMCDYDTIMDYCWYENVTKPSNYHRLVAMVNNKPTTMHSLLGMNNPDHINRNPLDNRRENLDNFASKQTQMQNRGLPKNNTSGCKGVGFNNTLNKWRARIEVNGKEIYLGLFNKKDDAIISRLMAEKKYFNKRSWQTKLMAKYNLLNREELL